MYGVLDQQYARGGNLRRKSASKAEEARAVLNDISPSRCPLCCELKEPRVDRDNNGACRHKHRTCSRRQYDTKWIEDARRERYSNGVVASRPPEVLHHLSIRAARQPHNSDDIERRAPHEYDVSCLNRHIGACPYRNAHVSLRDSRSVVDSITDHGNNQTTGLHLLYFHHLVLRQDLGKVLVKPHLLCHPLRHLLAVAGEHEAAYAHLLEPGDCLP